MNDLALRIIITLLVGVFISGFVGVIAIITKHDAISFSAIVTMVGLAAAIFITVVVGIWIYRG